MRKRTQLRAVGWTVASLLCLLGTLILQGCSDSEPSPYAELDEKFPTGRPGIVGLEARTQDSAYMDKIGESIKELSALQAAAAEATKKAESFKSQVTAMWLQREGTDTPQPDAINAILARNDHYKKLLKEAEAAKAAVAAKLDANRQLIRERMWADATTYDAMRAEADAKAKAAGLPVRSAPPLSSQPATPTAKPLSETSATQTGTLEQ